MNESIEMLTKDDWIEARAQAALAVATLHSGAGLTGFAIEVNAVAHLILTGELPTPELGVYWT